MTPHPSRTGTSARRRALSRPRAIALGAVPVVALPAVAGFAPLRYSVARPGQTTDVLGAHGGGEVISTSGAAVRKTSGQLRMVAIQATAPTAAQVQPAPKGLRLVPVTTLNGAVQALRALAKGRPVPGC